MIIKRRNMIVPAEDQVPAQMLCAHLAEGRAGENMFTTPLSKTGLPPATHYISSGPIEEAFAEMLPLTSINEEGVEETRPADTTTVEYLAAQSGLTVPEGLIAGVLSRAFVTDADLIGPLEAITLRDLKFVQEEETWTS